MKSIHIERKLALWLDEHQLSTSINSWIFLMRRVLWKPMVLEHIRWRPWGWCWDWAQNLKRSYSVVKDRDASTFVWESNHYICNKLDSNEQEVSVGAPWICKLTGRVCIQNSFEILYSLIFSVAESYLTCDVATLFSLYYMYSSPVYIWQNEKVCRKGYVSWTNSSYF